MSEATEKISGFLNNLSFKKKAIGGVDEQDVLLHFSELDGLYQKAFIEKLGAAKASLQEKQEEVNQLKLKIEELENGLENKTPANSDEINQLNKTIAQLSEQHQQEKNGLEEKLQTALLRAQEAERNAQSYSGNDSQLKNQNDVLLRENLALRSEGEAMRGTIDELRGGNAVLVDENEQLKSQIALLGQNRDSAAKSYGGYSDGSKGTVEELLALKESYIDEVIREKEAIIAEARNEANEIVKKAIIEKEKLKLNSRIEADQIQKEKKALASELGTILEQMKTVLDNTGEDGAINSGDKMIQ